MWQRKSAMQRVIVWLKQHPIRFCVWFSGCEFLFNHGYLDSGRIKAACTRSKQFVAVAFHPSSSSSFRSNLSTLFPQLLVESWQQIKSLITSFHQFLPLYGNDYHGSNRKLVESLGLYITIFTSIPIQKNFYDTCYLSYIIISKIYNIISYHVISYHIISYHISYHIISYHIISYHIISYHIISYHNITYHFIF